MDLVIEAYIEADQFQVGVSVNDLFKVEAVGPEFTSALKFITSAKKHLWPPTSLTLTSTKPKREKNVMVTLCSEIFLQLSNEVTLESMYRSFLTKGPPVPLQAGPIGMGAPNTWHGTPDARVRGTSIVSLQRSEDCYQVREFSDDESDTSDGTATEVEGKLVFGENNLIQAIATCVVSSFTAKTRHPDMQAVVPTIIIDEENFRVCLYDCERDVLLISNKKLLATKGHLSRSGLAFLWLVINHR